jgi:hypothetical protein
MRQLDREPSVCYSRGASVFLGPLVILPWLVILPGLAGLAQPPAPDMACRYSIRGEQRVTRRVHDGFSVTVRRKTDPAPDAHACVIEVHDPSGRLVLMREGFNTKLHDDSGRDVDNDGSPDVIVGIDSRGTNWCCSEDTILSLRPAHVIGTFANPTVEVDGDRRTVVWAAVSFDDLGSNLGPAPAIAIAGQYRDGRFVDLTAERCSAILAGTSRGWLNLSEDLWQLEGSRRAASRAETGEPSFDVEATRASATAVALQMLYCGRDADARELIRQVWPDDRQEAIRASLAAAVAAARRR